MTFSVRMMDTQTGKVFDSNSDLARLARMRRRIKAWSEAIASLELDQRHIRKVMITLTYQPGAEWQKNHIRDFVYALKRRLGDGLMAAAWVAEMQKRGAVHYHLFIIVKRGTRVPKPDESGLWPWGTSNIQTGRSPYYLVAYLKGTGKDKAYQKMGFPKGCRIFSVWLNKSFFRVWVVTLFRWSALPTWLRQELEIFGFYFVGLHPKPKEGGGWSLFIPEDRRPYIRYNRPVMDFHSPWVLV